MVKTRIKDNGETRFKGSARAVMVTQFFDNNDNDKTNLVYIGMGDPQADLLTAIHHLRTMTDQLVKDPEERLHLIADMGKELLDGIFEKENNEEEKGDQ